MIVILSIINIIFVCVFFLTILKDSFMNTLHKSIK